MYCGTVDLVVDQLANAFAHLAPALRALRHERRQARLAELRIAQCRSEIDDGIAQSRADPVVLTLGCEDPVGQVVRAEQGIVRYLDASLHAGPRPDQVQA
ncbi:hypothetical protein GCM10023319_67690 [Nocardia iowensis]